MQINRKLISSGFLFLSTFLSACAELVPHHGCYVADPYLRGNYVGMCQNNLAHGRGRAVGKDMYDGEFVNGVAHGYGTYVWQDGDRFVGQFQSGQVHGNGVMVYNDGRRLAGVWERGRWVRATSY